MKKYEKIFVSVNAVFDTEGNVIPKKIIFDDGNSVTIRSVKETVRASSLKAGGIGLRFTCNIGRRSVYLFYEDPKWFVEGIKSDIS